MKEHGQEVMDTTEHCMEAMKMAQNLKDKCGHVFDPEVLGAFAYLGIIGVIGIGSQPPLVQELMNSTFVKSAKVKAMQESCERKNTKAYRTFVEKLTAWLV